MADAVAASFDRMQYYLAVKKIKQYETVLVKLGILPAHFAREAKHLRQDVLDGLPHADNITELRAIVERFELFRGEVLTCEFKVCEQTGVVRTEHGTDVVGTAKLEEPHYGPKAFGHVSQRRKVRITINNGAVYSGLYFPDTGHARTNRIKGANRGKDERTERTAESGPPVFEGRGSAAV